MTSCPVWYLQLVPLLAAATRTAPSVTDSQEMVWPSHWLITRSSFAYLNQEMYSSQTSQAGTVLRREKVGPEHNRLLLDSSLAKETYALLRKNPPKSIIGMIRVGAIARAILISLEMQLIKYPKPTTTWVRSSTMMIA